VGLESPIDSNLFPPKRLVFPGLREQALESVAMSFPRVVAGMGS
jgi:hypothetical protein